MNTMTHTLAVFESREPDGHPSVMFDNETNAAISQAFDWGDTYEGGAIEDDGQFPGLTIRDDIESRLKVQRAEHMLSLPRIRKIFDDPDHCEWLNNLFALEMFYEQFDGGLE